MTPHTQDHVTSALVASLPSLRRLASMLARDPAEAEDLLQATCLRVLERGPNSRGAASNIFGFSARVMRNLHIDQARSRRRWSALTPQALDKVPAPEPAAPAAWRCIDEAELGAALEQVRPNFRDAWSLWVEGLPYDQIAGRLGIPRSTVSTRLLRARRALRQILEDQLAAREASIPSGTAHGGNRQVRSPPCLRLLTPTSSADSAPALARDHLRQHETDVPTKAPEKNAGAPLRSWA
jgi:RNA polymerase sigma-70 factor, ECF subfamily